MSVSLAAPRREARPARGLTPSRRAVVRWAWRLFRREWRQQLLVLALIIVAVTATIFGSAVATNTPPPANSGFGTAQDMATFAGTDPRLAAEIAALEHRFGKVDVIENETLKVPGSVDTYQLRAQNPNGPYGQPMLSLVSGHYPTAADQVAVTAGVASDFNLKVGDTWRVGGEARRVVGIVENPQSLLDEFALVLPGQVKSPNDVTVLFDAPGVEPSSIGEQCAACGPYGGRGSNVTTPASVALSTINPETLSLAVLTIGMLLIALMAIGGFTVLAQRRQRSLGMLASIGATSKNVSLVVRANGLVVGVLGAVIGTRLGACHLARLSTEPRAEFSSPDRSPRPALGRRRGGDRARRRRDLPGRLAARPFHHEALRHGRPVRSSRPTETGPPICAARDRLSRRRIPSARLLGQHKAPGAAVRAHPSSSSGSSPSFPRSSCWRRSSSSGSGDSPGTPRLPSGSRSVTSLATGLALPRPSPRSASA